jgi:hypothetical protein
MKTVTAFGEYVVSFNTYIGDIEVGETCMDTIDFAGEDVDALAAEVIAYDTSYPIMFDPIDDGSCVEGVFRAVDDLEYIVAVMYKDETRTYNFTKIR